MKRKILKNIMAITAISIMLSGCQSSQEESGTPDNLVKEENLSGEVTLEEMVTPEVLFENDFILYYVNCAATATKEIQGDYPIGLFQSVSDQPYGTDTAAGKAWGYIEEEYMVAAGEVDSRNPQESSWEIKEGTEYVENMGYEYKFELPNGTYEVICGFSNPFSARTVDIQAEDTVAVSELKILKYKDIQGVFEQEVTDGTLDILVYNSKRGKDAMKNPILSYIVVRAVPEYDNELLDRMLAKTAFTEEEL